MSRSKTAARLAAIPLFERCSDSELDHLAALCTQVTFAPGDALTTQGDVGQEFYVLTAGRAAVLRDGDVRDTIEVGGHVGELSLLDRHPRSATLVAVEPVTAVRLGFPEFWEAISTSPSLDRALLAAMAGRLRTTMERLEIAELSLP